MFGRLTAAAAALVLIGAGAVAQLSPPLPPIAPPPIVVPPPTVLTPQGPAMITGPTGGPASVMIPGSAVPGTMFNNGNGTSTILVPGGPSQAVPAPR